MGLVEYSDSSDSDVEKAVPPPLKKQRTISGGPKSKLPALPTGFHDLYATSIRVSVRDDPNLHGGRKRVIPHVEGNWPTHLYLEWYPQRDELDVLEDILSRCRAGLNGTSRVISLLSSDLGVQLPLHISLSRPVVLTTDQKQPFIETLENAVKTSATSSFTVIPDTLDWVSNSEQTRWFLVTRLRKPKNDELNKLLLICNQILDACNQPLLYAIEISSNSKAKVPKSHSDSTKAEDYTPCFHISLAWTLSEPSTEDQQRVRNISLEKLVHLKIRFDSIKAKIGNVIHSLKLDRA